MAFLDRADARLYYEVCGDGSPVLFIQGIGVIGAGWKYQTDTLCEEFQCLSFDNRGIGQSTSTATSLTVEQMAQDALALMDAQGWEKAHVVGHSMGGAIAQALALAAPERVKSLSFLCTFAKGSQGARMTPDVIKMGLRTRIGTRTMRRHAFMEMLFSPEYLAEHPTDQLATDLIPVIGRDVADSPPVLMKQLQALGVYDGSAQLGQLAHIPTLVVSGELDPIALPEFGVQLAALIPGACYVDVPRTAHGVIIQDPVGTNTLLRDHFRAASA
ncbi:MAG: putative hydrolase [Chthonomonadales bacterium]|nr:putative hydrolase [Chthonomonadales bacterium]